MKGQLDSLDLNWNSIEVYLDDKLSSQTQRYFLDCEVSGKSFAEFVQASEMIGVLGWGVRTYGIDTIERLSLQKASELPSGRYLLYVCPSCGDVGCGAITMAIEERDDAILWKAFGYENGYEDIDFRSYKGIEFRFPREDYLRLFSDLKQCLLEKSRFKNRLLHTIDA